MKPLQINPLLKLRYHLRALFGCTSFDFLEGATFEFSRSTGRIKHFFVQDKLAGTFRTDGGIALTIHGAQVLLANKEFAAGYSVTAVADAVPFVSEGRSLFCRHVKACGLAVAAGSEVGVLDENGHIIAVGVALLNAGSTAEYGKGVAVKVREGIRSRDATSPDKD